MSNEIESSSSPEDHWEIYVSYVDDHPAVILVDVGIAQVAPLEDKPTLVWLWVHVQAPDEEGFPTEEEDMKLNEIEDVLTDSIDLGDAEYVGRITSDGRREFYFYTNDPEQFRQAATSAISDRKGRAMTTHLNQAGRT